MLYYNSALLAFTALASAATTLNETIFNYAPVEEKCPAKDATYFYNSTTNEGYIRANDVISQDEYSYIAARQVKTSDNLINFLDDLKIPDYNQTSFSDYFDILNQTTINVGLAFSGGGFRALFTGAGEIMALDSRTTNDSSLKGLLDSSAYISGLSGGSILLSTLLFNNWTSVEELINSNTTIWNTTNPPVSSDLTFWTGLLEEVMPKKEAGYEITLVDLYGRILSRYMFEKDDDNYGLNTLWSDIKYTDAFVDYDLPFPMILATGGVDSNISDFSRNVFEITPFEFGSFSPFVGGFIPIEILGTSLDAGLAINGTNCTYEFDNTGFMVATSSNILADFQDDLQGFLSGNPLYAELVTKELGKNISVAYAELLLGMVNKDFNNTLFSLVDNPFYNSTLAYNETDITDVDVLKMVDGGFFEESIPLDPFLTPARQLDIVFAFDNSAQTHDNWPNGETLYSTEERWFESFPEDKFYELPASIEDFVDLGLNKRPVFFGCNGSNLITDETGSNSSIEFNYMKPLLVYIPNTNYTAMSNITNYQFSYEERNAVIGNGFEIAQYNNEEDDFAQCVGCAIIRRSEERANIEISPFCKQCFSKYCFDSGYENVTISEVVPTSIYSSSALPSKFSSLLSRKTASAAFPTSFSALH